MRLSDKISSGILERLYWHRKMSSLRIARIYRCSPEYIRDLLKKYGIRIRTKSEARQLLFNINIPKASLEYFYLRERKSSIEIAKKFNCSSGFIRKKLKEYKIPVRSYKEALAISNKSPYPQKDFGGNLEEKAYLLGFSKGDLWVHSTSKLSSSIFIQTNSTKPKFIQLVEDLFCSYGYVRKSNPAKNGAICIRFSLNRSFNFLLEEKDYINPWILDNTKFFGAFLAGYIDAEGTFCLIRHKGVFSIRSQDKNILKQIYAKLIELGILLRPPCIVRKRGTEDVKGTISNKDIWAIFMHRKDAILKLIDLIGPCLKHQQKKKEMEIVKNNIFERDKKYNNRQDRRWCNLYLKGGINYVRT